MISIIVSVENNYCKSNTLLCFSLEYPPELTSALEGNFDQSTIADQETKMVAMFQNPDRNRKWREGALKSSFNYLLLDPRVTSNLPLRCGILGKSVHMEVNPG